MSKAACSNTMFTSLSTMFLALLFVMRLMPSLPLVILVVVARHITAWVEATLHAAEMALTQTDEVEFAPAIR